MQLKAAAAATLLVGLATPALSCTLTLGTPGTLGISTSGQYLGSTQPGGVAATMTVATVGPSTMTVQPPTYTQVPSGYSGAGDTMEIGYTGSGLISGVTQAFTTGVTQFGVPNLLGIGTVIVTFNSRATTATGFRNGTYQMRTIVTCS